MLLGTWRYVFAALAVYAVILIALTARLPETLPPEGRIPLRIGAILGALARAGRSWMLWRLALANAFGFAAQFVFIASAAIVVTDLLHLGEQDFWVMFVPLIVGMMSGSWVTGHVAVDRRRLITIGFVGTVVMCLVNLALVALAPTPTGELGWPVAAAVIGPALIAFAVALLFSPVQLEALDVLPHERGSASSLVTFVQLTMNTLLAGVVAPVATASLTTFALTALGFAVVGTMLWIWHALATERPAANA